MYVKGAKGKKYKKTCLTLIPQHYSLTLFISA